MVALLLLAFNAIAVVGLQTGDGALQSKTPGVQAQGFQRVAAQEDPELVNNDVYELSFVEGGEPLRGTGGHPLYSLDRDDWVRVRELQVGERLQTADGAVTVEALEKVRGVHRVYNLEVEGDHQYLIGEAGVRAHNAGFNVPDVPGVYIVTNAAEGVRTLEVPGLGRVVWQAGCSVVATRRASS